MLHAKLASGKALHALAVMLQKSSKAFEIGLEELSEFQIRQRTDQLISTAWF